MEEKKTAKKRFTLLDAVIILVVIAALAFVAYKMMPTGSTAAYEDVTLSFYAPDVPDYVAEQLYVGQLQDTLRLQENAVQGMLDDASALLMETCDNYRLIDVGRSAEQDPWQVTEMACSELGRLVSMHRDISSAYLVCNLPRFVCTSHSLQPYEMDAFFDVSWLNQYFASQQGIQLLDTPRPVTTPARNQDTYISLVSRVSYLSTLKNKWLTAFRA